MPSTWWWSTSTLSSDDRGSGLYARARNREYRHRRAGHAARRGQESCLGQLCRPAPRTTHGFCPRWPNITAASAPPCAATWPCGPLNTPPPTTAPSPTIWARELRMMQARNLRPHIEPAVPQGAGSALRRKPAPERRLLPRATASGSSLASAQQLQGKALLQQHRRYRCGAGLRQVSSPEPPASSSNTPTPAAWRWAPTLLDAYERAFATDPESAFGGIIAFNVELDDTPPGRSSSVSSSR
jgi:hypothetical protein